MNIRFPAKIGAVSLLVCMLAVAPIAGGQLRAPPPWTAAAAAPSLAEYAGVFERKGLSRLPYRMAVVGAELPGDYALVVFFHGIGERGNDNQKQVTLAYAPLIRYCVDNRIKAVLLFPQCPKRGFWAPVAPPTANIPLAPRPTAPMASAIQLIAEHRAMYNPARIFAVGASMGGYGVWDMLSRCPNLFSAAVIVCGGGDVEQAANLRSIPIHVVHGEEDPVVPVARSRAMVRAIWNAGGDRIVYKEAPRAGHEIWNDVFDDQATWQWLFAHQATL